MYLNESEPRDFAEQIAWVFEELHWPFSGIRLTENELNEGVTVGFGQKLSIPTRDKPTHTTAMEGEWQQMRETEDFAKSISLVLSGAGIDAKTGFIAGVGDLVPSSVLIIGVGTKPNRELEEALRELGIPEATPLPVSGNTMGTNRVAIPDEPVTDPQQHHQ